MFTDYNESFIKKIFGDKGTSSTILTVWFTPSGAL